MNLDMSPEYEAFRASVRSFLEEHGAAAAGGSGDGAAPSEEQKRWQRLLVEHGFVGRTIPREYGGFGAEPDLLEALIIEEEFADAGVSLGMRNQGIDMLVPTLLRFGSDEQKRSCIGPTLRGELIWCQGYSEPEAGSDLASLRTRAVPDGDDFVLNGQKIWTSTAQVADRMFALVRTDREATKHAGISYLLLSMDTPGIEVRPLRTMTGEASFNEVFFTDVRVPRSNVVGREGQGWEVGTATLRYERGMLGAPQQSDRFYRGALRILRQTGLAESPLYRERLAQLQARLLAMRCHGMRLVTDRLQGRDSGVSALIVKLDGCQLNYDLCALALDALGERGLLQEGAAGVVEDGDWPKRWMYSLGLIIGGGTAQIQKNIISEAGLGMPREPKAGA